ncbi:MAG: hypothetical protein QOF66_2359 [Mycobacterium sp.]|jgi:hypothetical protein|nr:hypothetical protein [Mycobacterium sp.]
MARHKITIQPASEAELANITHWYQETGLPPVGDTDAGIVNATFRDAHRSGLLGSALGRGVARATVMPLHPQPHETLLTRSCATSSRLDGHTIGMLVVRRAASSTGSMRNCSPITNPLRPKTAGFTGNRDYPRLCQMHCAAGSFISHRRWTVRELRLG